jgi:hypothetical protein
MQLKVFTKGNFLVIYDFFNFKDLIKLKKEMKNKFNIVVNSFLNFTIANKVTPHAKMSTGFP